MGACVCVYVYVCVYMYIECVGLLGLQYEGLMARDPWVLSA